MIVSLLVIVIIVCFLCVCPLDADNGEQEADKPAASVYVILAVSGVVATATVCGTILAIVVLHSRAKRFVINETVGSTLAISNPACLAGDINRTI